MFRTRSTLLAASAVGSLLGLGTLTGAAHAGYDDIAIGHAVDCQSLSLSVSATNNGATPEQISFAMVLTEGSWVSAAYTMEPGTTETHTFPLSVGDVIESVAIRDAALNHIESTTLDLAVINGSDCTRPAVNDVHANTFVVTCDGEWLHVSAEVENAGDYDASMAFWADGAWADEATDSAAYNAGWNMFEQFPLAPGATYQLEGDFKVNDSYEFRLHNWTTDQTVLWGPPRPLSEAELACGGNVPAGETTPTEETTPASNPTAPTGGNGAAGGGATLPSTGSTWLLAAIAAALSAAGTVMMRTTRRRA
jgi:hypothetical protein